MLDVYEAALIRGWIQGVGWTVLGETYLNDMPAAAVRRQVADLRQGLARKAERLGRGDFQVLWSRARRGGEDWQTRALGALEWLQNQGEPVPQPDHRVALWFPPRLARSLERAGVTTVGRLLQRLRTLGADWFREIPQCGAGGARRVRAWVMDNANALGLDEPDISFDSRSTGRKTSPPVKQTAVVPLERFLLPKALDGSHGLYRAPPEQCTIAAGDDLQAIHRWLALRDPGNPTYRHYRKEAERFLLWAVLEEKTPLSSLTTDALGRYRAFLEDPQPTERWTGPMLARNSPHWKPFQGPLSRRSRQQAETILKGMCRWWVQQRYLSVNAFDGLPKFAAKHRIHVDRAFSEAEWAWLLSYCRRQIAARPAAGDRYRRIDWILQLAYRTGLRLRELAAARVGDLERRGGPPGADDRWWLQVTGKGHKRRQVPLVGSVMDRLTVNLTARGYRQPLPRINPDTPLIGRLRKTLRHTAEGPVIIDSPLTDGGLHQILRPFFKTAAEALRQADPAAAARLGQATTHWLRHTHGSHALASGVPLAMLRDNLGHQNIATTSDYVHAGDAERHEAVSRWAELHGSALEQQAADPDDLK